MDKLAFLLGDIPVYWNSLILLLAGCTAICFFLSRWLPRSDGAAALPAVPMAVLLSLVLARFLHWYFRTDSYASLAAAMLDMTAGGYALVGVFAGCFLTALILRLAGFTRDLPAMLDAMCIGGSCGIALGRMACLYSPSDRGMVLSDTVGRLFSWPVTNTVTGQPEYRLATFALQAAACAVIFLILIGYGRKHRRSGNITLLFLLFYGMSQAILDSTRYDSLYFRSNGFIGVSQLLGAFAMVFVSIVCSVRVVKTTGFRPAQILLWIVKAAMMGLAGYMEYYVQRHGNLAPYTYTIMTIALTVLTLLTLGEFRRSSRAAEEQSVRTVYGSR